MRETAGRPLPKFASSSLRTKCSSYSDSVPFESPASRPKLTSRGAATRNRIVLAAAELMHVQGVAATTIDDVLAASATSKSQFYQHFEDKTELVYEVITLRADEILSWQRLRLEKVDSFRGLYQWRDAMVQRCTLRRGLWGCELGSLAAELSDTDDRARASLAEHFAEWRGLLAAALERMRDGDVFAPMPTSERSQRDCSPPSRAATCYRRPGAIRDSCRRR